MKTTLLLTTYNRPLYLKRCLDSLRRASITDILIIDDCSTDAETLNLISTYPHIRKQQRTGICGSLLLGIERAFDNGAEIVINLDADAIVRNDYMQRMIDLHTLFPNNIVTGFHSTTKNKDGSERHEIVDSGIIDWQKLNLSYGGSTHWLRKRSVGGINMLWTRFTWNKHKPVIENCAINGGNWDNMVSLASPGIICPTESLVQHIGVESSMNHNADVPDIADSFRMLSLPNVTLVCVDDNATRGREALNKCCKEIEFGAVKNLSNQMLPYIPRLNSKEAYSSFIINDLHKYINTEFALIVQHDGYIKNPEAWSDSFTEYDYIGATWWFKDGMNVGNGGFSLRSKKLLELTAQMNWPVTHPEDNVICRVHRKELEQRGIKFAPETIAQQFSFEGYYQHGTWNGQFGFHGARAFRRPANPSMQGFIINQFLGLGDILFLVPLIRYWMGLGHDVIWPIADEYFDIKRNFPDIQFVRKSDWPRVSYDSRIEVAHQWAYGRYVVKPLRWNLSRILSEAMTTKYSMYGQDWKIWRGLNWERDTIKENELMNLVQATGEYELICQEFGNVTDGGATYKAIESDGRKVYLSKLIGYNLLDWSLIIENATIIHAVSSSTLYLFETLNLKAKEVHLYSRKAGMNDFEMVRPIMTKNYILHV